MGQPFADEKLLTLTPRYYQIQGRAAEIARNLATPTGAEHLFLGMLHAGGWPVCLIAPLVDLGAAENAVLRLLREPGYTPPPHPRFPANDSDAPIWGAEAAWAMDDSHIGLEHMLLAMIRARDCVPARALASLAGLNAREAAVLAERDDPLGPPPDAVFLPVGQPLDQRLRHALVAALPADTTYGFNAGTDGRTWLHVFGPVPGTDPALTRRVLAAALASLDQPPPAG